MSQDKLQEALVYLKKHGELTMSQETIAEIMVSYHASEMERLKALLPSDEEIEKDGAEGGLRDWELQLYFEGAQWMRKRLSQLIERGEG